MPWIIGLGASQPYSREKFQEMLWERFRGLSGIFPEFLPESPSRTGGMAHLCSFCQAHNPVLVDTLVALNRRLWIENRSIQKWSGVAPASQTKERSVHELFTGAFRNKTSMWIVLVFLKEKHQNSQKMGEIHELFFVSTLSLVWFAGANAEMSDLNRAIPRLRLHIDRLRFGLVILSRFSATLLYRTATPLMFVLLAVLISAIPRPRLPNDQKNLISLEIFNLDRNFWSHSKISNSTSRFPHKNRAAVGGSLENFILARSFQSRSISRNVLIFGPSGSPTILGIVPSAIRDSMPLRCQPLKNC